METLSGQAKIKYLGLAKPEKAFMDSSLDVEKSRIIPKELLARLDPSSATDSKATRTTKHQTPSPFEVANHLQSIQENNQLPINL